MSVVNYQEIPPHRLALYVISADDTLLKDVVFPQLTHNQYYYLSKTLDGKKLSLLLEVKPLTEKVTNATNSIQSVNQPK